MNEQGKNRISVENSAFFASVKEILNENHEVNFTVMGTSMTPIIRNGLDSVVIKKAEPKDVKKGDVILFSPVDDKYLLHRITKITQEGFESTGDGNIFRDGFFPFDTLIAKVIKIERKGKIIPENNFFYKLYAKVWMALFPIRKYLLAILFRAYKIKVLLKGNNKK